MAQKLVGKVHKFQIIRDWYEENDKLYTKSSVTLKEGVTILCGCNGCGKTTLIQQLIEHCKQKHLPYLYFDNLKDGGSTGREESLFQNNLQMLATAMCSSEGENINLNLSRFAGKMGNFVRKHQDADEVFFFLDAIDSGLSIDNVIDIKQYLFQSVLEDFENRGKSVYIIVSANEYELARNENCLDTLNLKYVTFPDYDAFRNYIIETRKAKSIRYNQPEWCEKNTDFRIVQEYDKIE